MNIAIFSDTYLPEVNGVATSTNILFEELVAHGNNVWVVTSNPFSKKITVENNIIRMPGIVLKHLYNYIATSTYSRKIMKILKKLNLDVIHIQCDLFVSQFGWIASSVLGCATVYTYHTMYEDYTWYATRGAADRFAKWSVREYSKTVAYKSTEFIVPSIKTKDYVRRIGINNYINVIPTGIQITKYSNYEMDIERKNNLYKTFDIKENSIICLALGRVAAEKNIEEVVTFFKRFRNDNNEYDLRLIVVGDGPQREKIIKECLADNSNTFIHMIGKVPLSDVPFFYNLSSIYLSGSTSETQGLTYIEAMASHVVPIVRYDSNLVGLIDDSVNGYFYENYDEFSEKFLEFLKLDLTYKSRMSENAFASANTLSSTTFYEKVIEVYNRAIRENW